MHVKPAEVWAARLRDAPAATAAQAILAELLGYRDSHLLHADDVKQLASALEAWGLLVLAGGYPEGGPFVPPTEGERSALAATSIANGFASAERAKATAPAPTDHELEVLQMIAGEREWAPWGAWIGACVEFLQEDGYVTRGQTLKATPKGLAVLAALKPQHDGAT